MIQLRVLSGRMAGSQTAARRFPFWIGREAGVGLVLDEPGVWARHARVEYQSGEGFQVAAEGDALVSVNGQPVRETRLRNGDRVGVGSVQLQFWLSEVRQRRLGLREGLVWCGILLVTAAQLALIYQLLR